VTLASIKSASQSVFSKAKRESFNANLSTARKAGEEIAALAAAGKKSNLFSSRERKADARYVQESAAWAKARVAELDAAAAKISTADRKTITQFATLAATNSPQLQSTLVQVRIVAARLTAPKS
jgi:hypothetical protein